MSHWMFNCKKVSMMVSESMDQKFPLHRRIMITAHLMMCRYCHRFKKQLLVLRNAVALEEIHEEDLGTPSSLSEETRERIKQAMTDLLLDPDPDSLKT
jgi:thioredoxin-related protein